MGIVGKKIAAIRAYVAEGGGADYHEALNLLIEYILDTEDKAL